MTEGTIDARIDRNLEIKFDNLLILENIRNNAIKEGSLPESNLNTKVNFKLIYNNKKYPGEGWNKIPAKITVTFIKNCLY